MIVLVMNAPAESGKGTVAKYIKEMFSLKLEQYSSIDYVKEVAKDKFGWNGVKDVEGRNLLAGIKQLMISYNDMPTKKVLRNISKGILKKLDVLVVDIREPDEIEKTVNACERILIKCVTCRVHNEKSEATAQTNGLSLTGDRLYGKYDYDIDVYNNGTLKELKEEVIAKFDPVFVKAANSDSGKTPKSTSQKKPTYDNEKAPILPFASLIKGNTCSKCNSDDISASVAHACLLCYHCGQRYEQNWGIKK